MKTVRDPLGTAKFSASSSRSRPRARAQGSATFASEDLGRLIQAHSGLLSFAGLTLGVFVSRKFLVLPLAVALTLAQEMAKERLGVDGRSRR